MQVQEKKRVNREKAAASKAVKKAAADSAAAGSITDNSADQPSQVGNTLITELLHNARYTSAFHCHNHQLGPDLRTCCCCHSCVYLAQSLPLPAMFSDV